MKSTEVQSGVGCAVMCVPRIQKIQSYLIPSISHSSILTSLTLSIPKEALSLLCKLRMNMAPTIWTRSIWHMSKR